MSPILYKFQNNYFKTNTLTIEEVDIWKLAHLQVFKVSEMA